jgi:two-component system chemotaxis response regulator CheB
VNPRCDIVVIGASLGGLEALALILSALPATMPPIAVVQHRVAEDDGSHRLRDLLAGHTAMPVVEPDDKAGFVAGHVFLAPSDYHLQIEQGWFSLSTDPPVQFARPSIDVLFETAAEAYRRRVVAVVLTCSSVDGLAGAEAVRRHGGRVLVQEPASARSPVLPQAVVDAGLADVVAPLAQLSRHIAAAVSR